MFGKKDARKIIALLWVIVFALFIIMINSSLQPFKKDATKELDSLEQSIVNEDWSSAQMNQTSLKSLWEKNKTVVQLNNLTPGISRFEQKLAQVKTLVDQKRSSALEYIGDLRSTLKSITTIFPTPEG